MGERVEGGRDKFKNEIMIQANPPVDARGCRSVEPAGGGLKAENANEAGT
jgi:hypothetical protein